MSISLFRSHRSARPLRLILASGLLFACQAPAINSSSAQSTALASGARQSVNPPNAAPARSPSDTSGSPASVREVPAVVEPDRETASQPAPESPSETAPPALLAPPDPSPASPTPPEPEPAPSGSALSSPFESLSTQELDELSPFLNEDTADADTQNLSPEEENEIYSELFVGEQPAWEDFISFDLTTDGGALLLTDDSEFQLQSLNLLSAPKAWARKDRRRGARRVRLRRIAPDRVRLWVVQEITGRFLIDRDGTAEKPSPGEKALNERLIQQLELSRGDGRWSIQAASQAVIIPRRREAFLPRIQAVQVRNAKGKVLRRLTRPLQPVARHQSPVLVPNTKLTFEAKVSNADSRYGNPQFVYMHAFNRRLRMYDNGRQGDAVAGDGIYSRELETPNADAVTLRHLAFDAIASQTMANESEDNYQAMVWMLHFRSATAEGD